MDQGQLQAGKMSQDKPKNCLIANPLPKDAVSPFTTAKIEKSPGRIAEPTQAEVGSDQTIPKSPPGGSGSSMLAMTGQVLGKAVMGVGKLAVTVVKVAFKVAGVTFKALEKGLDALDKMLDGKGKSRDKNESRGKDQQMNKEDNEDKLNKSGKEDSKGMTFLKGAGKGLLALLKTGLKVMKIGFEIAKASVKLALNLVKVANNLVEDLTGMAPLGRKFETNLENSVGKLVDSVNPVSIYKKHFKKGEKSPVQEKEKEEEKEQSEKNLQNIKSFTPTEESLENATNQVLKLRRRNSI